MARINLLPWREELREQRKREFISVLAGVAIVGLGLLYLGHLSMMGQIEGQKKRNSLLESEISIMAKSVREIDKLKDKKEELLARMNVIQSLQGNRPIIVRVIDELVRTIPDGIFYSKLNRKGSNITFSGIADSNNRISSLMRRLDGSEWFAKPNLTSVSANVKYGPQASSFNMSAIITTPESLINKTEEES